MNAAFKTALVGTVALGITTATATAQNIVSGTVYEVSSALASNAVIPLPVLPPSTPYATFDAPSQPLSFDSRTAPNGYTLGGFLATGNASNIVYNDGAASADPIVGLLFDFKGEVTVNTGDTFQAGHDDGLELIIGGTTVINVPGATAFELTTSTYTGPSGNQPFELVYGECCSPPGVLSVDLPFRNVPEPASFAVVGAGLIGLAAVRFRR